MRTAGIEQLWVVAIAASVALATTACRRTIFDKWDVERQCFEYFEGRVPGQKGRPVCDHTADGYTYYVDDDGNCWSGTWCDLETAWGWEPADVAYLEEHCGPLYEGEFSPLCSDLDDEAE